MDDYERRCKQALYRLEIDRGNGMFNYAELKRILEGHEQVGGSLV